MLLDAGFVLGGAEVAEGGMKPSRVVPAFDVLEDGTSEPCSRRPGPGVDELALEGGENESATALEHAVNSTRTR